MKESEIVRGYAQAIWAVAQGEGVLDQVEQELTRIKELLEKNNELQEFLKDPKVAADGKQKAMAEILGGEVSRVTRHGIELAVGQGRGGLLPKVIEAFFRLAAESRKRVTAQVTTAVPLTDEGKEKLEKTLSELTGEPVFLKMSVDPSLVGGFVVQIGERIIDGSVRGRLHRLRNDLSREILSGKGKLH